MKTENCLGKRNGIVMEAVQTKDEMTFGEFIVSFYDTWSEPGAGAMVSLALEAGLIVFSITGSDSPLAGEHKDEGAEQVRHGLAYSSYSDQAGRTRTISPLTTRE